jgi:hypothetical protein
MKLLKTIILALGLCLPVVAAATPRAGCPLISCCPDCDNCPLCPLGMHA